MIRALIRAGAGVDKDAKNDIGRTPLHVAVAGGKEAAAKALVMAGADVNTRDANKDAPLHLAIEGSHGGLADTLLLRGADPSVNNRDGVYPIHRAAYRGLDEAVLALAQKEVDLNSVDKYVWTPLRIAALQDNISNVRVLLAEGARPNFRMVSSFTVLHFTAENNEPIAIPALIDAGADIKAQTQKRRTPLYYAVRYHACAAMLSLLPAKGGESEREIR